MLELGKTYSLADGSGSGTVSATCFMVKISRPGKKYNGEVQHYDADGKYIGSLSWGGKGSTNSAVIWPAIT